MVHAYLYDLPVYRISSVAYNADMDARVAAQLDGMREVPGYEPPEHVVMFIKDHQYRKFGPWRFNEIVGYIRLHVLGTQIRGEYFSAEKKRSSTGRHKVFTYRTHKLAVEIEIRRQSFITSEQVWDAMQRYVDRCRKELKRGRVIEDSLLRALGPHVDWLAVLGWADSQKSEISARLEMTPKEPVKFEDPQ